MFVSLILFIITKKLKMSKEHTIHAYCMKTKEKNVPMVDAVITKTSKGGYMAQGTDGKGNKMTTMLSKDSAEAAVKAGTAKMG
jgi:hypothetical protein